MKERLKKENILTIPNAMSLFRLLLVPVIVYLYRAREDTVATLVVVAVSGLTDVADGKIARKFNMVSDVGKVLDPIADKLTQAALILCLAARYPLMWALIYLFIVKEALMVLWGLLVLKYTDGVNSAKWYGKLCTVVLYATMMALILFRGLPAAAANALMLACLAAMVLAVAGYGRFYAGILRKADAEPGIFWTRTGQALLVFVWIAVILTVFRFRDRITVESIVSHTPANPLLAVGVMLLLFALKSVSIVIYSGLLYVVSGMLFPLPAAVLVNLLGSVIMVTIPYVLGKKTGSGAVDSIVEKYPKAAALHTMRSRKDFLFTFLVRVIGRLPSDVVSIYMGAIGVAYPSFLLGSVMGFLPHTVTYPLMGGSITDPGDPRFWGSLCAEILYVLASVLLYRWRQKKRPPEGETSQ